ncbi:MAG: hypothetical protein ACOC1K_00880 [Nanoarchaeota archaeon]
MNTIIKVADDIKSFVENHSVFESFLFDDISHYPKIDNDIRYPLLFLSPSALVLSQNNQVIYNCELIISDIVDDIRTYTEVSNECSLLSQEFLTYFDENNDSFYYYIQPLGDFTFFPNGFDKSAGVYGRINIITPFNYCSNTIRMK